MVIADLHIKSIAVVEPETNAPLVINRYGMLAFTIIGQLKQLVPWRNLKVVQSRGQIDIFQLPRSPRVHIGRELIGRS